MPSIDPKKEERRITEFLKETLAKTSLSGIVVAVSGGVDSAVSLALVTKAIGKEKTRALFLPYKDLSIDALNRAKTYVEQLALPQKNAITIDITSIVHTIVDTLTVPADASLRKGNIMARSRMIALYDYAKTNNLLVCGTENRSEYYLGYFTRFGDEASDIEPIRHLYKTQIYQLAEYLGVSREIIASSPSANLWGGQTDEGEFGFSYKEADEVLSKHFDHGISEEQLLKEYKNAEAIFKLVKQNGFKHEVPYIPDFAD